MTQDRIPLDAGSSRPAMEGEMELLPCPFCGSSGEELLMFCDPQEGRDNSGPSRRIQCAVCHVEAPYYDTEAEAIEAWNRRALPSAPAVEGVEPVAWRTRGMNVLSRWLPWVMVDQVRAERWREDPSYKNGRREVEPLYPASAISRLQRLVDGIDDERRGALDLCIERNKQIQALEKDVSRLTALLAEADEVLAADDLASTVAAIRQGHSSSPRCEPPGQAEIDIAKKWTRYVLEAISARRYQQKREAK